MTEHNIHTTTTTTGEPLNHGGSPRFSLWVAFWVFATITLGSSVEIKNEIDNPNEAVKWAIACSAITFSVAAIVSIMHLIPIAATCIVGTVVEGIVSFVLVGFWTATVAIVTKPSNKLAFVSTSREINANLFFFSWAGFVTSLVLFISYLKSALGVDLLGSVHQRGARLTSWAALIATSFIVMGSSLRVMNSNCSSNNNSQTEEYCTRTKLGIAMGAVGFAFALLVVTLKLFCRVDSVIYEFVPAFILAILNGVGVAFVTSNSGPGSSIGNLYFGSWISFLLAGAIAAECFNHFKRGNNGAGTDMKEQDVTPSSTFNVEDMDETDNL
eukprot:scaffold184_cov179-Amphora_coffeaeformis.AAC.14